MGDVWDYKLRKLQMVWELAVRVIPSQPQNTGPWSSEHFYERTQETLEKFQAIVNTIFADDKVTPRIG